MPVPIVRFLRTAMESHAISWRSAVRSFSRVPDGVQSIFAVARAMQRRMPARFATDSVEDFGRKK